MGEHTGAEWLRGGKEPRPPRLLSHTATVARAQRWPSNEKGLQYGEYPS